MTPRGDILAGKEAEKTEGRRETEPEADAGHLTRLPSVSVYTSTSNSTMCTTSVY